MRSTYFLGCLAAGLLVAVAPGCDDGSSDGEGGAGGGTTTTTETNSGGGGGGTTTTTTMGDGNDTFETAEEIVIGDQATIGNLDPVGEDVDYYMFQGQAGQKLVLGVDAKPDENPSDPTYPDTVITLYDENQTQIAQNDDLILGQIQDSQLFTVLPADGVYYIRVAECSQVFGAASCGTLTEVVNTEYEVFVGEFIQSLLVDEMTPGPTTFEYSGMAGSYEQKILNGTFSADLETDTFEFTVPADVMVDPDTRSLTQFTFFEFGPDGSGSTAAVERATIVDGNTGTPVAQIDGEKGGTILVPLMPGGFYEVRFEHNTGAVGANPFYFGWTFPEISSNPLEREIIDGTPNNTLASAGDLTSAGRMITGGMAYDIEGDLEAAGAQIDLFRFPVTGYTKALALCSSRVDGSGVIDLSVSILDGNGMPVVDATETAAEDAFTDEVDIPAGNDALFLRIGGDLDPMLSSNYYRCVVAAYNP